MNAHSPRRRSLVERAAAAYDFDALLRAPEAPAEVAPAPAAVPASEPKPAAKPRPVETIVEAVPAPLPLAVRPRGTVDRVALAEAGFIAPDAAPTTLAEELRIVKRQLLLTAFGEGASPRDRMILVASAQPNEGKTFCTVNLALSLATERDHEVVLVDADFAKPEVLSTLGLSAGPGLLDAVADRSIDLESCLIQTDIGRLSVLPAGRHSNEATEMLASGRMRELLERLVAHKPNRVVLFDSAPMLAASMASELAHLVGQALLVVRADVTGESDLRQAMQLLAGCQHLRLLLNGASFHRKGRRFGSYYGMGE